ncbi:MAG TPA: hypothetical protein VIN71_07560 [Pseudomonadales bacterium]
MQCPACQQPGFRFLAVWCWPFGVKTCSACGQQVKVQRHHGLNAASVLLASAACVPVLAGGKLWLLLPGVVIALVVDALLEKRWRRLVCVNTTVS